MGYMPREKEQHRPGREKKNKPFHAGMGNTDGYVK
jgi:hypothetical protein